MVQEFQHVKPGKGGAFVRTKIKNVVNGKVIDKTFNAGVKVDVANVDRAEMQYLYNDGEGFVFMDTKPMIKSRCRSPWVGDASTTSSRANDYSALTTASRFTLKCHLL